jgi:hypothetical protein
MKSNNIKSVILTLVMALQVISTSLSATTPLLVGVPVEQPVIYLNGRHLNLAKDSLVITSTGKLKVTFLNASADAKPIKFTVVIRHLNKRPGFFYSSFDERYLDGKLFDSIDIETILSKTQVFDQLLIIPQDNGKEYTNYPIVVNVIGDHC